MNGPPDHAAHGESRSGPRLLLGSLLLWLPLLVASDTLRPDGSWVAPPQRTILPPGPVTRTLHGGVEVVVNGVPVRCTLDTAQSVALMLHPSAARRLGLVSQGQLLLGDGSRDGILWAECAWVDRVDIGGARFEGVPTAVLPGRIHAPGVEGSIGYALFGQCSFQLDLSAETLRIEEAGILADVESANVLELSPGDKLPRVSVQIGDHMVSAILDSGNRGGMLIPESLAVRLPAQMSEDRCRRIRTLFTDHDAVPGKISGSLKIGRYHLPQLDFLANCGLPEVNLGARVLQRFVLCFDPSSDRVRLDPVDPGRWRPLAGG